MSRNSAPLPPTDLLDALSAHASAPSPPCALSTPVHGVAVGRLEAVGADGVITVNVPAMLLSGLVARSLVPLDASHAGQSLALGFEGGNALRPIVLGLMLDAAPARPVAAEVDVLVDGERVVLTAEHEIELRCGEAAIVLSADGRIQLRGTYITSQASATQRILGGSVNVN